MRIERPILIMELLLQKATALPDHEIELEFSNGERRVFDVKPYLDKGIFTQLKDWNYFSRVQAHSRFVSWPGEQDFSLDTLWARSRVLDAADQSPA